MRNITEQEIKYIQIGLENVEVIDIDIKPEPILCGVYNSGCITTSGVDISNKRLIASFVGKNFYVIQCH